MVAMLKDAEGGVPVARLAARGERASKGISRL